MHVLCKKHKIDKKGKSRGAQKNFKNLKLNTKYIEKIARYVII